VGLDAFKDRHCNTFIPLFNRDLSKEVFSLLISYLSLEFFSFGGICACEPVYVVRWIPVFHFGLASGNCFVRPKDKTISV
jgi:hypothetical protein